MSADLHAVLHEVWLRVHNRRFDDLQPDTLYRGIQIAESEILAVAVEHGIDWHALRRAPGEPA